MKFATLPLPSALCALLALPLLAQTPSPSRQSAAQPQPVQAQEQPALDLPTSKRLSAVPGMPQRLNSLPMSMALSPDGHYAVTVNAGYGTFESGYMQSLAVLDTTTGALTDMPESKSGAGRESKQTLYSGLQFSRDGKHVYASIASLTNPVGDGKKNTGSGVLVYAFDAGKLTLERIVPVPARTLSGSHFTLLGEGDGKIGIPFPADLALIKGATPADDRLLVADNLSDQVLLMNVAEGATPTVVTQFDLAENDAVPSTYPIALTVAPDGKHAYVALWNASELVELDLQRGTVGRKLPLLKPALATAAGSHPCALVFNAEGSRLYVALSNRDAVAVVDTAHGAFRTAGFFDVRLPHQSYFGAEPEALALSADGSRLYAGEAITDAIAVLDTHQMTPRAARKGMVEPIGFVPTEWMPMAMAMGHGPSAGKLYLATAKGRGTGPNNQPQPLTKAQASAAAKGEQRGPARPFTYIGTLLHGSLATLDTASLERDLKASTATVIADNRIRAGEEKIRFADGSLAGYSAATPQAAGMGRIKHVIYIIKENRTYDQLFGDLTLNGKTVGNGDPTLTMYGADITPNQHRMAMQFGVLDNFYDSGEVSGDGHVWSNAAIGSDYLEKTWEQSYRNGQRTYDFEGVVAEGLPLLQHIADVNEPGSGYLWGNLAAHGRTLYHFGEYISSVFCGEKGRARINPQDGPLTGNAACTRKEIAPGEAIPENWGGGKNLWPWAIPMLASNTATKPELVGHFAPETPDFNLRVPDQVRVAIFLKHLEQWKADRAAGHDTMPNFINLRLANDHTAGTTPGGPTPKSSIADNDLAIGRAVEAISHSDFWDDTAFFILEDDAQNGADHVDAHRSMALVVSKYAPHPNSAAGQPGIPFIDSSFYSTVSVVRTMETLLGLPPMNSNDAFSSLMRDEFSGPGDQPAFTIDAGNRDNGLIYQANKPSARGARESSRMDFKHADRADAQKLNVILWQDAMGEKPVPAALYEKRKKTKDDDD